VKTIVCDGCGYWEYYLPDGTVHETRQYLARFFGWRHERGGKDYCGEC
jgi:hypothetical protein